MVLSHRPSVIGLCCALVEISLETIYASIIITAFIDATSSTGQLSASYPVWRAFDAVTDLPSPARCTQTLSIGAPDRRVSVSSASEPASERTNGQKSRRSPLQTLYDGDQVSPPRNAPWASFTSRFSLGARR